MTEIAPPIRIAIAEDDVDLLRLLVLQFQGQQSVKVCVTARDGEELVEKLRSADVDIALLDVEMPGMDGVQAVSQISQCFPAVKTIMYTAFERRERLDAALAAGAVGFLTKDMKIPEVVAALHAVMVGEKVMSPSALSAAFTSIRQSARDKDSDQRWMEEVELLTPARREVYELLKTGKSHTEIAETLAKSPTTVRVTAQKIYEIFGCESAPDFVHQATLAENRYKSLLHVDDRDG